ncbi:MAG TPA: hypothetical protein VFS76_10430 [Pyrinomonadaceae bacterium]|nr:hypothetical protein [Pyrinomonadaceae bacterium]
MQAAPGTGKYERLLVCCETLAPVPTAVVHACEELVLTGAVEVAQKGFSDPFPVGQAAKIKEVADSAGLDNARRAKP